MMFQSLGQVGDATSQVLGAASLTPTESPIVGWFNRLTGTTTTTGTDASQYDPTKAADCAWCAANPKLAFFAPSCAVLSDEICTPATAAQGNIAAGWATGSAPAAPPSQSTIDSQTPNQTINQIINDTQINGVAAALAAANNVPTTVCTQGTPTYNAFTCFMNANGGTVALIGAALVIVLIAKK